MNINSILLFLVSCLFCIVFGYELGKEQTKIDVEEAKQNNTIMPRKDFNWFRTLFVF